MNPDKHRQGLSGIAWSLDIELQASKYGDRLLEPIESLTKRQSSLAFVWFWGWTGPDPAEEL
jgi:hypothetical protein